MAEVAAHLTPTDGHTNATLKFVGFDTTGEDSNATCRFDMRDESGSFVGTLYVPVGPQSEPGINPMVAAAHVKVTNILRQWLYVNDKMRQAYER